MGDNGGSGLMQCGGDIYLLVMIPSRAACDLPAIFLFDIDTTDNIIDNLEACNYRQLLFFANLLWI